MALKKRSYKFSPRAENASNNDTEIELSQNQVSRRIGHIIQNELGRRVSNNERSEIYKKFDELYDDVHGYRARVSSLNWGANRKKNYVEEALKRYIQDSIHQNNNQGNNGNARNSRTNRTGNNSRNNRTSNRTNGAINRRDREEIINGAKEKMIDSIIESHPMFKENRQYIIDHTRQSVMEGKFDELERAASSGERAGWTNKQKKDYIKESLERYVGSFHPLDYNAKEVILHKAIGHPTRFLMGKKHLRRNEKRAMRELHEDNYLENIVRNAYEMEQFIKQGNLAGEFPEFSDTVKEIKYQGFLIPVLRIMRGNGSIDDKTYRALRNEKYNTILDKHSKLLDFISDYGQQTAAVILGIFGIALIFMGANFTGNVVGASSSRPLVVGVIGVFSFLLSLLFFLVPARKKRKSKK